MTPDDIQALAAIAQTVLALATFVVTVMLSLFAYFGTKQIAKIEYGRAIRDAWLTIDTTALSNDEMLKVADLLVDPNSTNDTVEVRRKKWFAYLLLNPLLSGFEGNRKGFLEDKYVRNSLEQTLKPLMADDDIFSLTQGRGYPQDFARYCRKLRNEHATCSRHST